MIVHSLHRKINRKGREEQKFAFFHPLAKRGTKETKGKKKRWNLLLTKKYEG